MATALFFVLYPALCLAVVEVEASLVFTRVDEWRRESNAVVIDKK